MAGVWFEILLLVLANGVFALSEISVVAARKIRLQQRAEEGNHRARLALDLANAPEQFLSTVQVGITLVGILAGAYGGATISRPLAAFILVEGSAPMKDVLSRLDVALPDDEAGAYHTIAGFIMARLGHIPHTTDAFDYSG
ncbi:MAG: DUF21 domain-containing protein [Acidobacteria bacterium]|nr:DUF21 domain-containing protein [Acidobacteriota bacterium]